VLFPAPQRITRPGGPSSDLNAAVEFDADPTLPAEGFVLDTTGPRPRLRHADEAGRRYGLDALAQLDPAQPGAVIEDWPDLPVRGFMLDVSRDRVPTRETLARLVGLLRQARYNQLQLYNEHAFAYPGHDEVWRDASPITVDDVEWLDDLGAANGIELVPNQQSFGHMNRWLSKPGYRHLAERPDAAGPEVLAPSDEAAELMHSLYRELLPRFRSRRVHIGCDEPFQLGSGVSHEAVERKGRARVYAEFVARLARPLAEQGYQVVVWGDVLRTDPSLFELLPEGTVAVPWNYEAPYPEGATPPLSDELAASMVRLGFQPEAVFRFAANAGPLADAGVPFWTAPGTGAWNTFVGRIDNAAANIADAVEVARGRGGQGVLVTEWGDNGHPQPPSVSFGPLLYGGAVAWALDANRGVDIAAALDDIAFADQARALGRAVVDLGLLWGQTGQRAVNCSPLFAALYGGGPFVWAEPDPDALGTVVAVIDAAIERIDGAEPHADDGEVVRRELRQAASLARLGAAALAGGAVLTGPVDVEAVLAEQRACWLLRSRPGGLDDSLTRMARALTSGGASS
jgi:hexosaminidase